VFHIAAFYKFTNLDDYASLRAPLLSVCNNSDVKGSILLASEGVNGTIAGPEEGVRAVLDHIRSDPRTAGLEAKHSTSESDPFLRLKVRLKAEIVSLGVGVVDSIQGTGTRVAPEEWNELIARPDVVLVDARNDYEYAVGSFSGATNPKTRSFTQFPDWIAANPDLNERTKIAMYCTGGIRCEKASAYLKDQGFDEIYQLDGGILKYLETTAEDQSAWEGECYVFDRRVSVGHGLVPGNKEICPNCNAVLAAEDRAGAGYLVGVTCDGCADTISDDRKTRFAERQQQIELAAERGDQHLGKRGKRSSQLHPVG
jgi:UPF0176 protein